jgi:hypothetical protein
MGFFAKVAASDVFIVMDNVQFPRNSWVNRVRIGGRGVPLWMTVPVRHLGRLDLPIAEVEISYESDWVTKHLRTIQQRYARAPFFRSVFEAMEETLASRSPLLAERNLAIIRMVLALCGIQRPIVRGSELRSRGSSSTLITAMCREIGANVYLAGQGAAGYDDLSVYTSAGIEYRTAGFVHPEYEQAASGPFEGGLSIADALFNVGPDCTRDLLLRSVHPSTIV